MLQYLNILENVLMYGSERNDRTGTGTIGTFGVEATYFLDEGFPLITTKKLHFKSILHELLWMLSGDTNIEYLKDNKVSIWDEWADENNELGPVYGKQWRKWSTYEKLEQLGEGKQIVLVDSVDQIKQLEDSLKNNPFSRRHILSAWNVADVQDMALPPCHMMAQFYVDEHEGEKYLSSLMYQRSADLFLGVPYNIASYSLLTMMFAKVLGYKPHVFKHVIGDAHIYKNHVEQVKTQIQRTPRPHPQIEFPKKDSILDYTYDDFRLKFYDPQPAIRGEVSV